ncbi:MAG TPA: hypothetical protein VI391_10060 [Thermoanaerobaculia bacterium]
MRKTVAALLLTGILSASTPIMMRGDRPGRDIGGDNPIVHFIKLIVRHLLPLDDSNNPTPPKP